MVRWIKQKSTRPLCVVGIYSNPSFKVVILLYLLRPVLTIYPSLVNFLIFTNCHISPEWCDIIYFVIIGNVSYQFAINYVILCHHICFFIIHAMSSLPLSFLLLILSSFCHHLLGYSFLITELLLTSMTTIIHISNTKWVEIPPNWCKNCFLE